MKVIDFFCLSRLLLKPVVFGFLICYALPAIATAAPSPESFNQPGELVLTLSEKYIESHIVGQKPRVTSTALGKQSEDQTKSKTSRIGCGLDVTPLASSDKSLGNRMIGECNFNYRY
jgi:hypothetical protein